MFPRTRQVSHYTDFIQKNDEWEFAGIYADEAISATNTKKRLDFHRLIDDCMAGKVDYIITKSVSRFARNTLDCLNYTRQLRDKNIPVFFEKENNEKYVGDALLQKTYTIDFLEKKRVINNEIVPQYYVENSHESIIPKDLHMQVQEEITRRANIYNSKSGGKRIYSSRYALSSIVFCGECGEIYLRVHWNNRGKKSVVWRCVNRLEEKGSDCPSQTIAEEVLQTGVTIAINQIIAGREGFITILSKNIETVLGTEFDMDTDDINAKLGTLQDEIMRLASSKSDYDNLAAEIHRLRSMKQDTQEHNAKRQTKRQRINEMTEFLAMQSGIITEYDDKLTRQLVEQITVFEDKFQVSFKSGVDIEVEI